MKILALEFSSSQRSVALLDDQTDAAKATGIFVVKIDGRRMRPLSLVEAVLRDAEIKPEQIECLVVGTGPGSYNGIRSAIAVAQGWQLAQPVRLLGISSVECLAAQAQNQGCAGRVNLVIDAQRNEFYLASYEVSSSQRRAVKPLRLATIAEVQSLLNAGELVTGPEVRRWFSGARPLFPEAATLANLAVGRADFLSGEKLEPVYLREINFVKAPPPQVLPFGHKL
ncbi:MAG TPA: tRNA (adenosine(37)-N6)-threonylcarbamoyltransferase complex dimerization subunit type 1 TsaB [Candidatus Eisenbacteria bacterium]|jgi:tRNA threonylcarbamoyl adenosine modification protein YeaZ|nr:tRNA (adenosine(37)-N6)-threonylcarbamoyltransferase complex dimerization subunit type 1 TsaB [Candidatus Eisenbacteria bacterium]